MPFGWLYKVPVKLPEYQSLTPDIRNDLQENALCLNSCFAHDTTSWLSKVENGSIWHQEIHNVWCMTGVGNKNKMNETGKGKCRFWYSTMVICHSAL